MADERSRVTTYHRAPALPVRALGQDSLSETSSRCSLAVVREDGPLPVCCCDGTSIERREPPQEAEGALRMAWLGESRYGRGIRVDTRTGAIERMAEETKLPEVQLLDCTLRDGGYYNDWDFATPLVQEYVTATAAAGISLIELGFRHVPADRYLGPLAYTTDDFITRLDIPDSITLGVMVDAKHIISGSEPTERVRRLFRPAADSRVDLVRIATNYVELKSLTPEITCLMELGYRVGVNLMQVSSRTAEEIARFGEMASTWGVEVAYIADSFGGMRNTEVGDIIGALRTTWAGPIGGHMHDNMTMALANSLAAIDAGATWIDGTVLGMGRGPGNTRSEYLAIELTRRGLANHDHLPLIGLVLGPFARLQQRYGWGSNVYYFLSAAFGVHPTYIHELTRDGRYGIAEVIAALEDLRDDGGRSYSRGRLDSATSPVTLSKGMGTYDATGWCAGRDVLIVGSGPAGQERRDDVEDFIARTSPLVIALNVQPPVDSTLVDAYVVCHPIRALMDAEKIARLTVPVFIPAEVASRIGGLPPELDSRDYGLAIAPGGLSITASGCTLPRLEAAGYALALAAAGGASRVLLSGFDGFDPRDERHATMSAIFTEFVELEQTPPVVAVTRTSYPVLQSSIFVPFAP